MPKCITVIPAKIQMHQNADAPLAKRRVAAYARVSTLKDEQKNSKEAQVDYYTKKIKSNPEWEFVDIYTDEESGTNTKKRTGFKQMVADALAGKIDLILTKSISRFARNTVDSLTTVRKLKEHNVEVYFQKENTYTFDGKGELMITIMSSLAQEESRSISENVTWGQRKRFADGKVSLPYGQFLGFEKGEDGLPKIVPVEAKIVQFIYREFLNGKTPSAIAKLLTTHKIPTPSGKLKPWQTAVIRSILTNEKYCGHALLQKGYTVDFLTKKRKINAGEVPQYFVEDSHDAIIHPDDWEMVQAEIKRRAGLKGIITCASTLSAKLVCSECGSFFGRKTWGSYKNNKDYKRYIWRCNNKYEGQKLRCNTPHLTEDVIKSAFVEQFNALIVNKSDLLTDCELAINTVCDCTEISSRIAELEKEINLIAEMAESAIKQTAKTGEENKHADYLRQYDKKTAQLKKLTAERDRRKAKELLVRQFMKQIEQSDVLTEFDEEYWAMTVDRVVVNSGGKLKFHWKG